MSDTVAPSPGPQAPVTASSSDQNSSVISRRAVIASFAIPSLIAGGLLFVMISFRDGVEAAVASVAGWLPVGYAFAAGMVASVNPCGFLMLPTYVAYHLGTREEGYYEQPAAQRAGKALVLGLVTTAGFLAILTTVGVIIAVGGQWLVRVFPYAGVIVGGGMAVLGIYLLVTHRTLGILAAGRVTVTSQRNPHNAFLFGMAYATGSLSCTLPIFLVVVGSSLASQDLVDSTVQFVGYGLGMGVILIAVTVGAALFRGAVSRGLRVAVPYVHRLSALFLLGAGAYLVYYWLFIAGL